MSLRTYLVGHYQYNDMKRPKIAVVDVRSKDTLPPTMLACMLQLVAPNKREAVRRWRLSPHGCRLQTLGYH